MSVRKVTMYRIVCDKDGCEASPGDTSDFYAWSDAEGAEAELEDSFYNWYRGVRGHYCPDHSPRCLHGDCNAPLWDDEFGVVCEDHSDDSASPTPEVAHA